jgi:spore coat polysaccharide biosynthesis predicted glycosyltransferase SpsG/L-amino acid N-acyltransferase YncA
MGSGHVMRCLALAQAWQDSRGLAALATASLPDELAERLIGEGVDVHRLDTQTADASDAAATRRLADELGASWLVVDGYGFDRAFLEAVLPAGGRLLHVIDHFDLDTPGRDVVAHLTLDQNVIPGGVRREANSRRILLGPRYALVRREFRAGAATDRRRDDVLVTFGRGAAPDLVKWIDATVARLTATADVGVAAAGTDAPEDLVGRTAGGGRVTWYREVADMAALMRASRVALAAAGSTSWELCASGVAAVLFVLAENQAPVADALDRVGAARSLGWWMRREPGEAAREVARLLESPTAVERMTAICRDLVDGRGARRVVYELRRGLLQVRSATPEDRDLLWKWVNDPAVRASSYSTEPISREEHVRWFERRLRDADTRLLLGLDATGRPVGQVRLEREGGVASIDVSIDPRRRREGWAPGLIAVATETALAEHWARQVDAWVKETNEASWHSFEEAGFDLADVSDRRGAPSRHYVAMGRHDGD